MNRIVFLLVLVWSGAIADHHVEILDTSICSPDGVALGGYDVVSYRQGEDGPQPGLQLWSHEHNGLVYRFVSESNRDAFIEDPDAFLPRYRGWCSATLAAGTLACPDFTNFKIEEGELLLFEVIGFTNGREVWNSDPLTYRRNADSNFLRMLAE